MPAPLHILHVSASFYPAIAFGGPIFSTKAITDGIACSPGYTLEVLSTDTADPNSSRRLDLPENPVSLPAGYTVRYCRRLLGASISIELLWRLLGAVQRADVVHLTGPYNFPVIPTLLVCRMTGTPLIWSPRGGFQATAQWKGAPKRRIKSIFEKFCAAIAPRGLVLHVTALVEADTCSRNFPGKKTALIPNAVDIPDELPVRGWRPEGRLRLAFLSRLHPKKGLDILITAMAALPDYVTLEIYGEGESSYLIELRQRIKEFTLEERITFHGAVTGDAKTRAFIDCDLFVLPTYSENFGIAVAEALAHGTPVLTTVNAPWEAMVAKGCGLWTEATTSALVQAINILERADLPSMGAAGREWMKSDFSSIGLTCAFEDLYRAVSHENEI